MKRSTLSILITAVILVAGLLAIWFFIIAPRLKPSPPAVTPPPVVTPPTSETPERHGALNVYLTAPAALPAGVVRAELTLVKATLVGKDAKASPAFEGAQRVTLQQGAVELALSELVANGSWSALKLEFSPAAELSMEDGSSLAALIEKREATLTFQADLPVNNSLAMLAPVPLAPTLKKASESWTAEISAEPVKAETYVFTSFMQDARGKGDVWTLAQMTLPNVIMADLGMDITTVLKGSQGFSAANGQPNAQPPQ